MRRITLWILSTVCVLVLLFSYHTSTEGFRSHDSSAIATAGGDGTGSSGGAASKGTSRGDGSYEGSVARTRCGPVQVMIKVSNGRIVDILTLRIPNSNHHDKRTNAYAVPILRERALEAQSADIDTVSGATVTSDGYRESLQAAIDAAHL